MSVSSLERVDGASLSPARDASAGDRRDAGSRAARVGLLGVAETSSRPSRLRVGEMFAGVGGFRLGLEPLGFEFAWANQWEPGKKEQHAARVYAEHFGAESVIVRDVRTLDAAQLPDVDMIVGGHPCQDFSVSVPLLKSLGLEGGKGSLWWDVARVIEAKRPKFVLLENVDRMLLSPAHQRGHDFGLMLKRYEELGYAVEWRVVNAADYGFPQRRRRTFVLATRDASEVRGVLDLAFPAKLKGKVGSCTLPADMRGFSFDFWASGHMVGGRVVTCGVEPVAEHVATLGGVLERGVAGRYLIPEENLAKWRYLKGAKNEPREAKATGHAYQYKEGALAFPDRSDMPSRTILTKEGSTAASRTSHAVADPETGKLRILTPVEVERLQGFPDGWTASAPEAFRYFAMGNALVVGVVRRIGEAMLKLGVVA